MKENQTPQLERKLALFICILAVCMCLGYAWFRQDLPDWWRSSGGGIPYTFFFVTVFFALVPKRSLLEFFVFLAIGWSCTAEFLQLWQAKWLVELRSSSLGAALLGSSFTWSDLPPYFLGGGLGYLVLQAMFWKLSLK